MDLYAHFQSPLLTSYYTSSEVGSKMVRQDLVSQQKLSVLGPKIALPSMLCSDGL